MSKQHCNHCRAHLMDEKKPEHFHSGFFISYRRTSPHEPNFKRRPRPHQYSTPNLTIQGLIATFAAA